MLSLLIHPFSHLRPGILSVAIFHGEQRARTSQDLLNHDVVLTTYSTLMADSSPKGRHVLQEISWFRVILDEGNVTLVSDIPSDPSILTIVIAHWIRNSATKQSTAALNLKAERRWCVSGTPIQNSMEDLLSMLKFLHLSPFSSRKVFEKHIISPLRSESPDAFQNLKLLLRAICLRRNSSLLNLEPATYETVPVSLTTEEHDIYKKIQSTCREEFDRITSQKSTLKRYSVLFTTILKLRRLCSHGPVAQLLEGQISPLKTKKKFKKDVSTDFESTCQYCSGDEDLSSLLQGLEICPECSRPLNLQGNLEPMALDSPSASDISPSPMYLGPESRSTTTLSSRSPSPLTPRFPSTTQFGQSSKIAAIADNIQQHAGDGKRYEQGQKPGYCCERANVESLIFSSWRDTLDNLARVLHERGISCLQIDGRVSPTDRESRLARFQQERTVLVLLISIQTGAVG